MSNLAYSTLVIPSDEQTTCASCGLAFAAPVISERRKDGKTFYCPNGHSLHFGDSEADRLRRELERTKTRLEWSQSAEKTAERRRAASQGQLTKMKNRIGRGVCPCCNRTFENLQRHMTGQHPEFTGKK